MRDAIQQAGDPLGRVVMRYAYDMLGNRIHQESMEAGARWMLNDASGKPIRAWDSRGHDFTTTYDALRRPVEQTVHGNFSDPDPTQPNSDPRTLNRDTLVDRIDYGETLATAEALNLRTRVYRHFDSAGVATNARLDAAGQPLEAYDFKGNLLSSTRQLVSDYQAIPDWSQNPTLDAETFEGATRYDALNRPIQSVAPHSSLTRPGHPNKFNVIQPVFNEANLLDRVDVWLERAAEPAVSLDPVDEAPSPVGVANIDYDAKGQRLQIDYKNGASTFYAYDPLTFRLTQLLTKRRAADFPGDDPQPPIAGWPGKQVQNLHYTYDPAGNITHIQDDAQQTVYFKNNRVEPSNEYVYDALYRLIQATGREHLGQGGAPIPHSDNDAGRVGLQHPGDGNAMGTYIERYVYDAVGNFLQMQHRGSDPANSGWTRAYDYLEPSLIEDGNASAPLEFSNRLTRTVLNPAGNTAQPEAYLHDAHGNMLRMPHLGGGLPAPNMHWNYNDQLQQTDLGGGGTAYYLYDAAGQRVRKVWQKAPGLIEERIYLGDFELFRGHGGPIKPGSVKLERETLYVMDDTQRVALVETRTLDTAGDDKAPAQLLRYQLGNHLGSGSLELDEQAQIISYEEYAPYGSATYQAVRSQTETPKRYRYTGKERDEESGLSYHGARFYAPWLGRWASCEPGGIRDGLNSFLYAYSNPVRWYDADGLAGTDSVAPPSFDIIQGSGPLSIPSDAETQRTMNRALQDYAEKTGIKPKDLVWMHPENRPKALTRAGERTTVTLGLASDNARQSGKERTLVQSARNRGDFARDTSGNDPSPLEGSRRRPTLAPQLPAQTPLANAPSPEPTKDAATGGQKPVDVDLAKVKGSDPTAPRATDAENGGWTTQVPKESEKISMGGVVGLVGLTLLFLDLREGLARAKTTDEAISIVGKHAAVSGGSMAAYSVLVRLLSASGLTGVARFLSGATEGLIIGEALRRIGSYSKDKSKDILEWAAKKVGFDLNAWADKQIEEQNRVFEKGGSSVRLVKGY